MKTLVITPLDEKQKEKIDQFSDMLDLVYTTDRDTIKEEIKDAEIVIGNPKAKELLGAGKLKWLQTTIAGVDYYLKRGLLPEQVVLTNASGSYGEAQSEFMLAMLLSLLKKLHLYRDNQRKAVWKDEGNEPLVRGATVLMIGLGDIGTEFSRLLKVFGTYIIGVRRDGTKSHAYADEVHAYTELDELIPRADIIAMVIPASPETDKLMSRERIALMKSNAVLVNTGRGMTVDNEALCDAVEQGRIAGAALDVYDPEPVPADHRVWGIDEIILTPHTAGGDFVPHTYVKILELIERNLTAYTKGEKLEHVVDRDIYEFR